MKYLCLILILTFTVDTMAQNPAACDSVIIDCCSLDTANNQQLVLIATNNNMQTLFGYPGFALLNSNMDTIAKETVNYFGIGQGPQQHLLQLQSFWTLPLNGFLQLYRGFYDSLVCQWPIMIDDTVSGIKIRDSHVQLNVFPNPSESNIRIDLNGFQADMIHVYSSDGRLMLTRTIQPGMAELLLDVNELDAGVYHLKLKDEENRIIGTATFLRN